MTPSLFDLPVRTSEAAEIASLVLEVAGTSVITDDTRQRIAARAKTLSLLQTRPYFGSLERDPVHASAIYFAVDAIEGQRMLLRVAPASTPSSGVFPKALLIGRVRGPKGIEVVINATPFGPGEHDAVKQFAIQVNPAFQPRPPGNRSALLVDTGKPEAAFDAFRIVMKERGLNFAGLTNLHQGTWAAIRTGWREGWVNADGPRTLRLATDSAEDILAATQQMSA